MLTTPMDVLNQFPIRKTKQQKQAFREAIISYAGDRGYAVTVQSGTRGVQNVIIGDPEQASYLVTAHYDTPASIGLPNFITPNNPVTYILIQFFLVGILLAISVGGAWLAAYATGMQQLMLPVWYVLYFGLLFLMLMGPANRNNANDNTSGVVTVLEIMTSLPENLRDRVCFVLFDLEERGLVGSSAYRKRYREATEKQIVLNLDCVGDGDVIQLVPVKKAKKDPALLEHLSTVCVAVGKKELRLRTKGFTAGSSDHKSFPKGVGIMAFRFKKGIGLYCGRIHTWRDTVLEYTNVNILRAAIISLISK